MEGRDGRRDVTGPLLKTKIPLVESNQKAKPTAKNVFLKGKN